MSEKRRDNRNRILRTGESQRKDGRYAYKYIDTFGKPAICLRLEVSTYRQDPGREDVTTYPLREKEKEIQKDLDDGIDTIGKENDCLRALRKADTGHRGNVQARHHNRGVQAADEAVGSG